jgi:site-specific DNA recombinase
METNHKVSRTKSEALLSGRIFDDQGHRMTPSHARRRGIKYRYYISSALLQGRPKQAGTVSRIPAHEIEALVIKAVSRMVLAQQPSILAARESRPSPARSASATCSSVK